MDGFELFCKGHVAILFIYPIFAAVLVWLAVKLPAKASDILIKICSIELLLCEALQDIQLTYEGGDFMGYLPLHLCNLGIFVNLLASFGKGRVREFFAEVSMTLIAPGSVFALVTPEWNYRPLFSWLPLMCFFTHMLLGALPLMMYARGYFKPSFRHFYYSYIFLIGAAVPIYIFDRITRCNYMFLLRAPSDTPLSWLESFMGNPGYLLGACGILAVVLIVIYTSFFLVGKLLTKLKAPAAV